ncbi:transglycosylase domain-containing protein [Candidatus Hydrogenosomobacter endosymbioticus]|uniref:peptidoglycan glycosyltransferase n=1 Tax=Candidatus Hydrogenosomobacter endosymbioticus TaxID=2558174 RepID=A0ABM7V8N1_9PROT|nr:PBP1A family penicillin-binding protein [Candidatus Hydrogenosomobacter endosymbioticus]BDB96148.1 penicillin-binding protein 1A [Candidatus Hydrogenosomobacter endosymbioticus]
MLTRFNKSNSAQKASSSKKKRRSFSVLSYVLKFFAMCALWGIIALIAIFFWFGYDLPDIEEISVIPRQPSIAILDSDGNTISVYGDLYGRSVKAEELPAHVINALLATEDRRFYSHFGIDIFGLARALLRNAKAGCVVQGGSTLTQQLAKNFLQSKKIYSTYDRSISRKISETILAFQIEYTFTKQQILTMYLNRVYMGAGAYGIDAAARRYFGKSATELGLYESAVLVGLLRAPSRYSPASSSERAEERAKQVLQAMVDSGFISEGAVAAIMARPEPLDEGVKMSSSRYFADWVLDTLPEVIDLSDEDIEVVTTINTSIQKIAEQQARRIMEKVGSKWSAEQVALVALSPDGAVRAMVGGLDYKTSKFNRAANAMRQPGSTFKFFVYLAALERGFSLESKISDTKFEFAGWSPKNYKYTSCGEISLARAFTFSVNVVAARLASIIGVKKVISISRRLGITTPLPRNLTIALGTGETTLLQMTGAFACISNNGTFAKPYGIALIKNKDGKVLYKYTPCEKKVLEKEVVEKMKTMMAQVISYGTGRYAAIPGKTAFGKTGTSQNYKDLWLIAMVDELVTGVWFGRDDAKPLETMKGGSPASHLWKAFTERALIYMEDPSSEKWDEDINPSNERGLPNIEKDKSDSAGENGRADDGDADDNNGSNEEDQESDDEADENNDEEDDAGDEPKVSERQNSSNEEKHHNYSQSRSGRSGVSSEKKDVPAAGGTERDKDLLRDIVNGMQE